MSSPASWREAKAHPADNIEHILTGYSASAEIALKIVRSGYAKRCVREKETNTKGWDVLRSPALGEMSTGKVVRTIRETRIGAA